MTVPTGTSPGLSSDAWAQSYRQHTTALRTWFVAFGVGGPAFLVANESAWKVFRMDPASRLIGALYLSGVICQVIITLVDKYADWFGYLSNVRADDVRRARDGITTYKGSEYRKARRLLRKADFADWWLRHDSFSIIADVLTVSLFAWATARVLFILLAQETAVAGPA
jgi:hypothetical protein